MSVEPDGDVRNQKPDGMSFGPSSRCDGMKVDQKLTHLSHALLHVRLRGACGAYLFPCVDGRSRGGGGRADRGAGRGAGGADRVDLAGHVVDLARQDGQVLGQVLADPAHTGEHPVNQTGI